MDTNINEPKELSPRQKALRDYETAYQGTPCKRCGGTRRYTKSSACTACMIRLVSANRKAWAQASKEWTKEKRRRDAAKAEAMAQALLAQAPQWDNGI